MISPTTPSIVSRELSMTCASSAITSGEVRRVESVRSRASDFVLLRPPPAPAGVGRAPPARRRCKTCIGVCGNTAEPMSRPSMTTSRPAAMARSLAVNPARTSGTLATAETCALIRVSRRNGSGSTPSNSITDSPSRNQHETLARSSRSATPGSVVRIDPLLQHEPCHRPVERPGVDVAEAQPVGQRPRHAAFARGGGTVDGDDHGRMGGRSIHGNEKGTAPLRFRLGPRGHAASGEQARFRG